MSNIIINPLLKFSDIIP